MFGKKKEPSALDRYVDPISDFSSSDLKRGIWFIKHKETLKRIFLTSFIVIDVVLFGYGFWGWGSYLFIGYNQDRLNEARMVAGFQNYAGQQVRYEATDLQFGTPEVFQSTEGKYDFVINVDNLNERWVAKITYHFTYNGGMTGKGEAILMPGARQPLVVYGMDAPSRPSSVRFQPDSIEWRSIDPHLVSDVKDYLEKRNQFSVSDVAFTKAGEADISSDRLTFTFANNSVFSYWSPTFIVELKDGSKRVGVASLTIEQFLASTSQPVDMRFFTANLFVTDVSVYPTINFFNQDEFIE